MKNMHSSNARDKILKSWQGISEDSIIKEVATKGEHIQLAIQYWARKRKISESEYELYFHDVVKTYVDRLLTEGLVCKAENVLRNVNRNVKYFYFQFAQECEDAELRETVLDYLRRKECQAFERDQQEMRFYWSLLQQLRSCTALLKKFREKLPRASLEGLINLEPSCQQRLFVELYFASGGTDQLLEQLNKYSVWEYLVDMQQVAILQRWCRLSCQEKEDSDSSTELSSLDAKFEQWLPESDMYEYALNNVLQPTEVLRNFFAYMGYFFKDEINNIPVVLRRIFTTESFDRHTELLKKLPLATFFFERGYYNLLLQPIVGKESLEEVASDDNHLLKFIIELKGADLEKREGFERIAKAAKTYLDSQSDDPGKVEEPHLTFFEFLCHEPSIASLNSFMASSSLNRVPYLKSLFLRTSEHATAQHSQPTPHDLLRKFKHINLTEFNRNEGDVASFSNERLCQRYARKYQLNYMHYLKQHRSAFAAYYLITEQLQLYSQITRAQLFHSCEAIIELALSQAGNNDLLTHCVACCEMLGFDTQYLRCFILLRKQLPESSRHSLNYSSLVQRIDEKLTLQIADAKPNDEFPLESYQALMCLAERSPRAQFPMLVLKHLAQKNDWWHLLVLLQYFDLPLSVVRSLVEFFENRTLGEHLLRALTNEMSDRHEKSNKRNATRQHKRHSEKCPENSAETQDTMSTSMSSFQETSQPSRSSFNNLSQNSRSEANGLGQVDLFSIILSSNNSGVVEEGSVTTLAKFLEIMQTTTHATQSTSWNLLRNCVKYQQPVLAVLATTTSVGENIAWCWLVWLTVSTEQWQDFLKWAMNSEQDYVWLVIKNAVRQGQSAAVLNSFQIFYSDNPFVHFCRFLHVTQNENDFSDESSVSELRLFLLGWSNDEVKLPLYRIQSREKIMERCINLMLLHMQHNFDSTLYQQKFLDCVCRSDINDICGLLDFCLLNQVFSIAATWMRQLSTNFELLAQRDSKEYACLLNTLVEAKAFQVAIQVATLLQFPVCDIVYSKWVSEYDNGILHAHEGYEREIKEHSLPPEVLVNFFLYASTHELDHTVRRFELLKSALEVIKQHHLFPNESFDRDQIEYDMVLSYLQIKDAADGAEDEERVRGAYYHSEYFEEIMVKERCVLYKTFSELKELAGVDDLSISLKVELTPQMKERLESLLNTLLDQGDIVEALRLQELFECRPTDLRFIVFCMALAEGMTTIYNLSSKERQLLGEIDKGAFARFNKLTLNQSSSGRSNCSVELSDSSSTLEFEEIPSKEKQQTLEILQGIVSKLTHGVDLAKRVVLVYRAAMYLDKEYLDVLRTKDVSVLLKSAAEEECLHRLMVVSDILVSTHMTSKEIAELLALEFATCIVRPRFYIFNANQQASNIFKNADLWGYNIDRDFHLFLELAPNTTMLGNCLLDYCDALKAYRKYQDNKPFEENDAFQRLTNIIARYGVPTPPSAAAAALAPITFASGTPQVLSHKKQNIIYVELLIKAHQCFVHECSMEGIANVLHRAKSLNTMLTSAKSWTLIVRMLIGIARYREMVYCFDALVENEQFESLLGQFNEEQKCGLRQAILSYLRDYNPKNSKELLKLAALHFLMYKELAEMWEGEAQSVLDKIRNLAQINVSHASAEQNAYLNVIASSGATRVQIPRLKSVAELLPLLRQALENYTHATENYLLDNKLLLAQQSVSMAELVAMQIDLANKSKENLHCVSVISVNTRDEFRELVNNELSVPQSLILGRAYGYDINWSEALLSQFVILQRKQYLREYLSHQKISDSIIENVVKGYMHYSQHNNLNSQMEASLVQLVELIKSVTLKYKLASLLGFKSLVMSLINDNTLYYLRDTNFGRTEKHNHNIPDM